MPQEKKLSLDKNEVQTHEKPKDIIGFAMQARAKKTNPKECEIVKYARRIVLTSKSDLAVEIKNMIGSLKQEYGKFTSAEIDAAIHARVQCDTKDSIKDVIYRPVPGGKPGQQERSCRRPLLEINKPTLLLFSTNIPGLKFVEPYIKPYDPDNKASTGARLDPNCSNLRSWEQDTVLGWYSAYDHGKSGIAGDFWYHLRYAIQSGSLNKNALGMMDGFFDPGDGSGGGAGFP